jgi:hypothetical protein
MTWLWWAVPLILVVYLWTLNEFLRGRLKELIAGVLAILIFLVVGIAFLVSGWKLGIAALSGAFVLSNLLRPVALAHARRLLTHPDLGFEDYGRRRLQRTMTDFGSEAYFRRREQEDKDEETHKHATIASATRIPAVTDALARFNASERDLGALYDRIEVNSLPPQVRKTVLENARLVAYFLENSEPNDSHDGRYTRNVSPDTHLRLQLWTHSNPAGNEPDY